MRDLTELEELLLRQTERLLMDKPDEHGVYVHLGHCNFSNRKSVTEARCNCPISRITDRYRRALMAIATSPHVWTRDQMIECALTALESGKSAGAVDPQAGSTGTPTTREEKND